MTSPEKKRVVITGIGVVAPNGIGKEEFWRNCFAGVSGIKPITLFDTSRYRCRLAGEISDFQPAHYLGSKGLRNLDRTTLLALVAAKLAIEDANLEITDDNRDEIGVVLGSTMGSVHSISEFDKEGLREGPRYVNPAQFPNTVINSPASQVAIRFGLRGLNATISTGFTASLEAVSYAWDMLTLGRTNVLLVGGVEELCIQLFLGFYKVGILATASNGAPPPYEPFDSRRSGTLLGEGAAFFVLERLEDAERRNAPAYGELLGHGTQFTASSLYRYDREASGATYAIQEALRQAELEPDRVDAVIASANATRACDPMEATALRKALGADTSVTVHAPKAVLGESFSAGGALQLAVAFGTLTRQQRPPLAEWGKLNGNGGVGETRTTIQRQAGPISRVLVSGVGLTGISSALIVGTPK